MASLATLGAWVGSAAVDQLVTRVTSFFGGQYKLQSDVQDKLQRLKELLLEIESVVEAAAGKDIKNMKLMEWFMELKEVAYDADDLLDTFEYRLLEKKVNEDNAVSSFASSSTNAFKRTLLLIDEDVNELNTLLERLERMASRVGNFLTLLCLDGQSKKLEGAIGQRLTGSLPTSEHSFVGRVKEKEEIINILLRTESSGARNIPVLPILGIGGVGKTTLVRVVYDEERVKSHFSLRMWVCVSERFDVTRITREILDQEDPGANYSGITNFNTLQENLKEKLSSKKFLLVLDDIWNDTEKTAWDTLKAPLCYGKNGSMILLTSRLPEVAKLMGTVGPIELEGLPEDEYWSFFKEQSFGGANPEEHPRLVAIGKKIASKLKGSPLAAKTMGALLKDNLNVNHWESISKSEIWEFEKGQDGIMAALKLSYLHLPPHLRQCFAYLSVTPKDWKFQPLDVIRMWMAQGMIHRDSRMKRIEDVGKDYFNELISKSFFQPSKYNTDEYTIHDLLHDLAEFVSKDDCFRIDGDEFRAIPTTIRHLVVINGEHLGRLKENTIVLEKLRTLILDEQFFGNTNYAVLQDVLIQLKKIRLLVLRRFHLKKCSDNLGSLIHLRYLGLPYSGSKEVPEELPKLYHLQTLVLSKLRWDCVPSGIANLINLRHIIGDDDTLSRVPGIGKLTHLQKLSMFRVQRDPQFQIVQLKYLRELCGRLTIQNLDCVDSKEEAKEANLCDKRHIEELCLVWDEKKNMKPDEVENGILEDLCPNPNLKWLTIDGYRGTMSPRWMVDNHLFSKLEKLEISKCRAWKELPPLGQLKLLKELTICDMDAVKEVGTGFHGEYGFPSLERLVLKGFPQWEEWSADEKVILFRRLKYFQIEGCPTLKSIPPLPTTLEKLDGKDALMAQRSSVEAANDAVKRLLLPDDEIRELKSLVGRLKRCLKEKKDIWSLLCAGRDEIRALESLVERLERRLKLRLEPLERHASNVGNFFQFVSLEGQSQEHAYISLPVEHSFVERLKEKKDINILGTTERPNQNLKQLTIYGYRGTLSPSWMVHKHSLTNIVNLRIYNCRAWEKLPPLGQLPWLQYLKICGMDAVKEVGTGFHGKDGFPSLELLVLEDFPLWEEWSADENVILFPRLQFFQIRGCPRLKSIPSLPTTLKELGIKDVGLTILPKLQMASSCPSNSLPSSSTASSSSSLKTLTITRCIALNQVGEWFIQHHNDLRHLEVVRNNFYGDERNSLSLNDNFYGDERKSLSLNGFSKLIALHTLEIGDCNIFVTSDTEEDSGLLFPSLKYLHLQNCFVAHNIMLKCLQGLSSLDKLKISRLPKIMTTSFAKGLQQLTRLKMLDISDCEELWSINSFIKSLKGSLEKLHISNCPKIECLHISGCKELRSIHMKGLSLLEELHISNCPKIEGLHISGCKEFRSIRMEGLCSLEELHISGCPKITSDIGLEQLAQLKRLFISRCEELSSLPRLEGLSSLEVLNISDCEELSWLPSLEGLSSLEVLNILGCPKITSIIGLKQLTTLKTLQISGCKELSSVPCLEALLMLQVLLVDECPKITIITGLEQLTELKWIEIRSCKELSSVPGLEALPRLTILEVDECPKLNSEEVEGIRRIRTRTERWYE